MNCTAASGVAGRRDTYRLAAGGECLGVRHGAGGCGKRPLPALNGLISPLTQRHCCHSYRGMGKHRGALGTVPVTASWSPPAGGRCQGRKPCSSASPGHSTAQRSTAQRSTTRPRERGPRRAPPSSWKSSPPAHRRHHPTTPSASHRSTLRRGRAAAPQRTQMPRRWLQQPAARAPPGGAGVYAGSCTDAAVAEASVRPRLPTRPPLHRMSHIHTHTHTMHPLPNPPIQ